MKSVGRAQVIFFYLFIVMDHFMQFLQSAFLLSGLKPFSLSSCNFRRIAETWK